MKNSIKNYALLATFVGTTALTTVSNSAEKFYEGFNYAFHRLLPVPLHGESGGGSTGFDEAWNVTNGQINVDVGSHTHPGALLPKAPSPTPPNGHALDIFDQGSSGSRSLNDSIFGSEVLQNAGDKFWVSFLLEAHENHTGEIGFTFNQSGNVNNESIISLKKTAGGYGARVGDSEAENQDFTPGYIPTLWIMKMTRLADDQQNNPRFGLDIYAPDAPVTDATIGNYLVSSVGSGTLSDYNGNDARLLMNMQGLSIDEFRGGTTLGDVAAVPEPATMAALGLGLASLIRRRRKQNN